MVSKEVKSKIPKIVVSVLVLLLISGPSLIDGRAPAMGSGALPAGGVTRVAPGPGAQGGGSSGSVAVTANSGQVVLGRSVRNDVSPRLRDIRPRPPGAGGEGAEAPENRALPSSDKQAG